MTSQRKVFYGWWILASGFVVVALLSATTSYGTALFLVPLTQEFGWSRTAIATALALARLETGIAGPLEGVMADRWGPRRVMLIGIPLATAGYLLWSQISSLSSLSGIDVLLVFYFAYVGWVAVGAGLGSSPVNVAVANWFVRRRGFALGIVSSGHGLGAAIWVPALGFVIQAHGWQWALVAQGLGILVIGLPAALVMRHRPEQYGLRPDGDPPTSPESRVQSPESEAVRRTPNSRLRNQGHTASAEGNVVRPGGGVGTRDSGPGTQDYTIGQAVGTSAFWCLAFAFAFRVMVTNAVQVHLAALLQDLGLSPLAAAGWLGTLSALSIVGRFGMGWLGDIFEARRVYMAALVLMVLGMLVLARAEEAWYIVPFLALYAPAYGGLAALPSALRADFFGRRAFGTISGVMGPVTTAGTMIGPLFAGYVFDTTGTYRQALLAFALCGLVSLGLMALAKRPR